MSKKVRHFWVYRILTLGESCVVDWSEDFLWELQEVVVVVYCPPIYTFPQKPMMSSDYSMSLSPSTSCSFWSLEHYHWIVFETMYTLNSVISTPQNVTHSLISWNPRERMFVVQISLLMVTFLSLVSWNLSLMQTTQEVNPHPRIAPCVFFFHLLNVGACIRHIVQERHVEWTTLALVIWERIQIVLTSPLCYFIMPHATLIL